MSENGLLAQAGLCVLSCTNTEVINVRRSFTYAKKQLCTIRIQTWAFDSQK